MSARLIGAALAATGLDRTALARLGGALGLAALAAADELVGTSEARARAQRAAWAAAARAAVPPGLRGVHPSWIDHALAGLPPRARTELASGGGRDAVGVWLVRQACAGLPPLPSADRTALPRTLTEATHLAGDVLARWLAHVGADQLALAVSTAGPEALAGAVRAAGDRVLVAWKRIVAAPRAGALGSSRAAIARCRLPLDGRALVLIGARALAPHTAADPLVRRQLAVRLSRDLGLAVEAELHAHAASPLEAAPHWSALAAPI